MYLFVEIPRYSDGGDDSNSEAEKEEQSRSDLEKHLNNRKKKKDSVSAKNSSNGT